jgi:hypothetical protein
MVYLVLFSTIDIFSTYGKSSTIAPNSKYSLFPTFLYLISLNISFTNIIATLALGSRPRQGLPRVHAKREAWESHFMLPGVQKSVRE